MLFGFASVLTFLVVGFIFLAVTLVFSRLIQAKGTPGADKYIPYECGEVPQGSAWIRFDTGACWNGSCRILVEVPFEDFGIIAGAV